MPEEKEHDEELEDFLKIMGQFRLKLTDVMRPLRRYGQDVYVDGCSEEIESLAFQMYLKLSGIDMPYEVEHKVHW
jgi:hypothetical protein